MNTNLITLTGIDNAHLAPAQTALAQRDALLASAKRGTCINGPASAQAAHGILREITAFVRTIEASRKDTKDPVIALGKRIDGVASTLTTELEAEVKRIGDLLATFQEGERQKADLARRQAADEVEKIRLAADKRDRDAQALHDKEQADRDAKAKEAQAEANRLAAKADNAKSEKTRTKLLEQQAEAAAHVNEVRIAQEQADMQTRRDAEAQRQADELAIAKTRSLTSLAAPTEIKGASLRYDYQFEITDIHELYAALPGMVLLSPNKAALKAHLRTLPVGMSLPGVKHWKEAKTSVR